MDKGKLKADLLSAIEEYVSTTESWNDAVLTIEPSTGRVELMESEEAEEMPEDKIDIWNPMDLVEMTPDGTWKPDPENIDSVLDEY